MSSDESNRHENGVAWSYQVAPLPDGGGSVRITPLDWKTISIEISGQERIVQRLAPGQTGEMDVIANRADGTSSLMHTLRVSRDQYGALKTVQIT